MSISNMNIKIMKLTLLATRKISVAELTKEIRDQFNKEGNYATNDIPGFEGTLEKLNALTIFSQS